jgi:L,D-peptidoglycan transpeptidase YkuD (ErfK/YbiS/YcfS/YnhG family)
MHIVITPHPTYPAALATFNGLSYEVVVGKNGVTAHKVEGDNATPVGTFALLSVLVRPSSRNSVTTKLFTALIEEDDVWCDDVRSQLYNQPMKLAEVGEMSHERMYRDDHLYDIVIDVDVNRSPAVPGKGSAIFIHLARNQDDPAATPTAGCIAFKRADLIELLSHCTPDTLLEVTPG